MIQQQRRPSYFLYIYYGNFNVLIALLFAVFWLCYLLKESIYRSSFLFLWLQSNRHEHSKTYLYLYVYNNIKCGIEHYLFFLLYIFSYLLSQNSKLCYSLVVWFFFPIFLPWSIITFPLFLYNLPNFDFYIVSISIHLISLSEIKYY